METTSELAEFSNLPAVISSSYEVLQAALDIMPQPTLLNEPIKGYYVSICGNSGCIYGTFMLGRMSPLTASVTMELAEEQNRRLCSNPEHVSGYQSRDPNDDMYGGSVRAGDILISPFGLIDELWNEAAAVAIAVMAFEEKMPASLVSRIKAESGNRWIAQLLKKLHLCPV
jgi:hypothetical protein